MIKKGIILAGGTGTRLNPITSAITKQLLPVYDKPMIFYPLTTLILAGVQSVLIIVKPNDEKLFFDLFGNGEKYGINIEYKIQESPNGIAEAIVIGEGFIDEDPFYLILGDNIFYGSDLPRFISNQTLSESRATVFCYQVSNPIDYGVITFENGKPIAIQEKPKDPKSNWAVTGLYSFPKNAVQKALRLKPSQRGELEISDLNNDYLLDGNLNVVKLGRGIAWLDAGSFSSLWEASTMVKLFQEKTGNLIGSPEEAALRKSRISVAKFKSNLSCLKSSTYKNLLERTLSEYE